MKLLKNNINVHIPELELKNIHNQLAIQNYSFYEVEQLLKEYIVPIPSELITSEYKEKAYADKYCYKIGNRYFLLKLSKAGYPYLRDL